jgi:hypothetical protein
VRARKYREQTSSSPTSTRLGEKAAHYCSKQHRVVFHFFFLGWKKNEFGNNPKIGYDKSLAHPLSHYN